MIFFFSAKIHYVLDLQFGPEIIAQHDLFLQRRNSELVQDHNEKLSLYTIEGKCYFSK